MRFLRFRNKDRARADDRRRDGDAECGPASEVEAGEAPEPAGRDEDLRRRRGDFSGSLSRGTAGGLRVAAPRLAALNAEKVGQDGCQHS